MAHGPMCQEEVVSETSWVEETAHMGDGGENFEKRQTDTANDPFGFRPS